MIINFFCVGHKKSNSKTNKEILDSRKSRCKDTNVGVVFVSFSFLSVAFKSQKTSFVELLVRGCWGERLTLARPTSL